ncbi:MAG: aldolase [Acidobacteria bacterium]|nr:aldolase [Acidobacteriota bacterium]
MPSNLRARLRAGETVFGVFCELPCPESIEISAFAGWDFAVIDCEHSSIPGSRLPDMVRAAGSAGMPAVVRVDQCNAAAIQHALDSGAAGLIVPQVVSTGQAEAAAHAARFHPLGTRGFNPFVRAGAYSLAPVAEYVRRGNEEAVLILQIESAQALDNVDAIAALAGVDVLFVGPYDLAQSLGVPGETSHERVIRAGAEIARKAVAAGKAAGVFVNSVDAARVWVDVGVTFVTCAVDSALLAGAMRSTIRGLRA